MMRMPARMSTATLPITAPAIRPGEGLDEPEVEDDDDVVVAASVAWTQLES